MNEYVGLVSDLIRIMTILESLETVNELLIGIYETTENQQTIAKILYLFQNQLGLGINEIESLINDIEKLK